MSTIGDARWGGSGTRADTRTDNGRTARPGSPGSVAEAGSSRVVHAPRSIRCMRNARWLRVECIRALRAGAAAVRIDLSKVEDADSSVLAVLVELLGLARSQCTSLIVACSTQVQHLLELYRLDQILGHWWDSRHRCLSFDPTHGSDSFPVSMTEEPS